MTDEPKTQRLNMRLLKPGSTVDDAFKKDDHGLAEVAWPDVPGARLFVGKAHEGTPGWQAFLESHAGNLGALWNQGAAALLFLPVGQRLMVVTFGAAHFFIELSRLERDFGLKVVLNTVDVDKLKSCDVRTPEEVTTTKRVQTSRQSEVSAFGIDVERDIVRAFTGQPRDKTFGSEVTGADSLIVRCKIEASDIHKKCAEVLEAYLKDDYKAHFGWIDHIKAVRDPELIKMLDETLVAALKIGALGALPDAMHLAPPELIDWGHFGKIKYIGFRSRTEYDRLEIADFLTELAVRNPAFDAEQFKGHFYVARDVDDSGNFYKTWKAYDCLVFETEHDGKQYVLSSGLWFCIEKAFSDEVDAFFEAMSSGPALPEAGEHQTEPAYNGGLCDAVAGLVCLDKLTIQAAGWNSGIEPCDFYSANREFIHIKNEASSSKLSHLFSQGVVAGEAFRRDQEFREALKALVANADGVIADTLGNPAVRPQSENYTIVYAVMRKPYADGSMGLPFFSKVALRNAARRLGDLGFQVAFSWIRKAAAEDEDGQQKEQAAA